ncbi:beta-1,3-glucosyltransferase-like [Dysidea avara]|uniref:beta-1,3-glucosyltransferase-like n=1 Tax=Dysidea avara TaxID=196820 RepID=UPI0033347E53
MEYTGFLTEFLLTFCVIWCCNHSSGSYAAAEVDIENNELEAMSQFTFNEVVFVLCSQQNSFHSQQAEVIRQKWMQELSALIKSPHVLATHDAWAPVGSWTIIPLLSVLSSKYADKPPLWFFFAKEETEIDFVKLHGTMKQYDPTLHSFLGHALQDSVPSILHHYASTSGDGVLRYPNFPSGWAMSYQLVSSLAKIDFKTPFNIDPQFELAFLARYKTGEDMVQVLFSPQTVAPDGVILTHVDEFCLQQSAIKSCATHYTQSVPFCGRSLSLSDIHIGVKTTEKFHNTRLPILKDTWGKEAGDSICYYSEIEDTAAGTTSLGIPNIESGYCSKMYAILKRAATHEELVTKSWLIITDDDTLLSVPRLLKMLACYNPMEPILMGETYGFMAHQPVGYTYITGGGGMVLSRSAVDRIISRGRTCPRDDYPDDMFLGTTAKALDIDVVSSNLFHQAQPYNYPAVVLARQTAISFHRHTEQDPRAVYRQYLKDDMTQDITTSIKEEL